MKVKNIVIGQKVSATKVQFAKELRRNMTSAEKILWAHLRGNQLDSLHFRRQQVIDGFIVDFYCHAAGLVVEVDGPIHQQQVEYDAKRDRILEARGFRILRISNDEVMQSVSNVLERIRQLCRELTKPANSLSEEEGALPK